MTINSYGFTPIGKIIDHGWIDSEGCWEFQGPRSERGYGKVGYRSKTLLAHRVMYEATRGESIENVVIRHTCDNPPCVNPIHLLAGTHQDNSDDKVSRERHLARGSHPRAKLSEGDVAEIRKLLGNKAIYQKDIAKRFNVSAGTISQIKTGRGWA